MIVYSPRRHGGTEKRRKRNKGSARNARNKFRIGFLRVSVVQIDPILLPLSRFHELPHLTFDEVALQPADVRDVEPAIEVVNFMLERACQQLFAADFEEFSRHVLRPDCGASRARYGLAEFRQTQAPFVL